MQQHNADHIEHKSKSGHVFKIRKVATRRDQSQMNIAMAEGMYGTDGTRINASPLKLYPWLFERFVIAWSGGSQNSGKDILEAVYNEPADPQEDLILVVGAYIFNHVEGLVPHKDDEDKKKG